MQPQLTELHLFSGQMIPTSLIIVCMMGSFLCQLCDPDLFCVNMAQNQSLNHTNLISAYLTVLTQCWFCLLQGSLNTYRFCDNVWTFVLNDVEFREVTDMVKVDKVKIVACDGKSESTQS